MRITIVTRATPDDIITSLILKAQGRISHVPHPLATVDARMAALDFDAGACGRDRLSPLAVFRAGCFGKLVHVAGRALGQAVAGAGTNRMLLLLRVVPFHLRRTLLGNATAIWRV